MKKNLMLLACAGLCGTFIFNSCKKDDDDPAPETPSEFVADNSTFSGWASWTLHETKKGADPALGEKAHGGKDTTFTRKIYIKDNAKLSGGTYPQGSLVFKHSASGNDSVHVYTGMAKRGGNFATATAGWEYFLLAADGSISKDADGNEQRGANLLACQGCHAAAKDKDYVFTAK